MGCGALTATGCGDHRRSDDLFGQRESVANGRARVSLERTSHVTAAAAHGLFLPHACRFCTIAACSAQLWDKHLVDPPLQLPSVTSLVHCMCSLSNLLGCQWRLHLPPTWRSSRRRWMGSVCAIGSSTCSRQNMRPTGSRILACISRLPKALVSALIE